MEKSELLKALRENRDVCVPVSMFGDDNIAKIDAMIRVIEEDRTENWCYDHVDGELLDSALAAIECLNGDCEIEDILFPVRN